MSPALASPRMEVRQPVIAGDHRLAADQQWRRVSEGCLFGIADRWKCTIFQSEPRLAITNVIRSGLQKGLPSNTPVELFNPAMTTAVSDRTMTSMN
jgi:hypothetical protein